MNWTSINFQNKKESKILNGLYDQLNSETLFQLIEKKFVLFHLFFKALMAQKKYIRLPNSKQSSRKRKSHPVGESAGILKIFESLIKGIWKIFFKPN